MNSLTWSANGRQKGNNVQFDFVTIFGFGVLVFAALLLYRHLRGGDAEEDDLAVSQRRDVLKAIKSMRKD